MIRHHLGDGGDEEPEQVSRVDGGFWLNFVGVLLKLDNVEMNTEAQKSGSY